MKYRIGLDMGATSIGWSLFDLDNQKLIDFGVRIFDDGREDKSKASLCVKRRKARGSRRLTHRRHIKISELLSILTRLNLMPTEKEEKEALKNKNPYILRKAALDRALSPFELGRVFMHLSKRKGFLSNRKEDKKEGGKLKGGYETLLSAMEENKARTYGEFLAKQLENNQKIRLSDLFDENGKYQGGLFPFRELYINEFDTIWEKQKEYWKDKSYFNILSDENYHKIKNVIFFQRPLKEADEGECLFEKGEKRIPRAHPLFQEFRIWQNITNLKFSDEKAFDKQASFRLVELLQNPVSVKTDKTGIITYKRIKKELGLDKFGSFNLEGKNNKFEDQNNKELASEKGLLVNTTQFAINKSHYFFSYWKDMDETQRGKLINVLARPHTYIEYPKTRISIEDENNLILEYLMNEFHLSVEAAQEVLFEIDFEPDFGSLSEKAIRKILGLMKNGIMYSDACQELYPTLSREHLDFLPYYGEILSQNCLGKKKNPRTPEEQYGKINNATVHVALNQIRHLVNEIIQKYGRPFDIAIEYARDLPASAKERQNMTKIREANEKENQKIKEELKLKCGDRNYTKYDITKYKIWKRLGSYSKEPLRKECPFTGKPISVPDLINGQNIQIEHLIPFSRSLDDSLDNKVLAYVEANRFKRNCTPFEAFGNSPGGYNWEKIVKMSKKLPIEQQWRFSKNAIEIFENKSSLIARSLNDTRYMTRLLYSYLQPIVREDGKQTVLSVVGALTSLIRKAWGLNLYKNKEEQELYRTFHNHHAIDAIIVSMVERNQLAHVAEMLRAIKKSVKDEFKDKFPLLKDEKISIEEKKKLKKEIKDFEKDRTNALVNEYFKMPSTLNITELLTKVKKINISHKPNLKDIAAKASTIGQLHEDTAYGLQCFVDANGLTAVFKQKKDRKNIKIIDYIPMFYDKQDKQAYYDAYKEWFILNKKASSMKAQGKEQKQQKQMMAEQELESIQKLRLTAQKAFKWFISGRNYCADVYQINPQNKIAGVPTNDQGKWKIEIVSNYNATIRQSRGEEISYWRYKYPNAKRVMCLRRNDMVMATFTRAQAFQERFPKGIAEYVREKFDQKNLIQEVDVLFRVKKMGNGIVSLTPHNIAKEDHDTKSWVASGSSLQTYKARKVFVSPMGKICYGKQNC